MMKKRLFPTELAYVAGEALIALGTALTALAGFGVSMVVAPAYLFHLKISEFLPFFSFGVAEYTFQAILLIFMMILLHRVRLTFLFSFLTAVLYGWMLDGFSALIGFLLPEPSFACRIALFAAGITATALGVAFMFRTYISPAVYELFVKKVSEAFSVPIGKFKTAYDLGSLIFAVILSFLFYGFMQFRGVQLGTVICALVNGPLITLFGKLLDRRFAFRDKLPWRSFFE